MSTSSKELIYKVQISTFFRIMGSYAELMLSKELLIRQYI
ncbi:hypothetical protein LEP1GSC045_4497 [Leptospira interrogans serovar Pomona str. Kennewicki LC82-25]|nr:hypothetical protein LEP1GSC045_4497 [Leptospira interrogans serovar Pomona str. Kennewicki LC82-25]EMF32913.1 hypothetical protein LEP1GSC201_1798 [Leptospira interrogans serovar Pomona str. Fox 32256]EMN33327.1 hypothetical protein LEP1GSC084_1877 [Leptospira interrogans serovar Medanensis str. L0448]